LLDRPALDIACAKPASDARPLVYKLQLRTSILVLAGSQLIH